MEEDYDNNFDLNGLNQALKNTDVELDSNQYEYLIWIYFQQTKDVRKLKRVSLQIEKKNPSLSSIKEEKEESYNEKHSVKVEDNKSPPKEIYSERENEEYTGFGDASELKRVSSFNPTSEEIPTTIVNIKPNNTLKQEDVIEEGINTLSFYLKLNYIDFAKEDNTGAEREIVKETTENIQTIRTERNSVKNNDN